MLSSVATGAGSSPVVSSNEARAVVTYGTNGDVGHKARYLNLLCYEDLPSWSRPVTGSVVWLISIRNQSEWAVMDAHS